MLYFHRHKVFILSDIKWPRAISRSNGPSSMPKPASRSKITSETWSWSKIRWDKAFEIGFWLIKLDDWSTKVPKDWYHPGWLHFCRRSRYGCRYPCHIWGHYCREALLQSSPYYRKLNLKNQIEAFSRITSTAADRAPPPIATRSPQWHRPIWNFTNWILDALPVLAPLAVNSLNTCSTIR